MNTEEKDRYILRTAGEVATMLDLKNSTLRKYCITLEKAGYKFSKDDRGYRSFNHDDITILERFIKHKNYSGMTVEQSAKAVVDIFRGAVVSSGDIQSQQEEERHNAVTKDELEEFMKKQEKFNQHLLEKLDERLSKQEQQMDTQQRYVEQLLEERQNDRQLLESMNDKKKWFEFWKK
ncbi:MerR family transcriptional regulator [Alkalibacillus haloalkaliphilus]|uniref:MerR family transcriptional regulator n=1 Tax=Alkalibacillus haloalkaliphilus TaxID=94136 RepID=UPI0029364BC0|nr:MerR family transcriptional regulator [Alkalibacillus haloalkaliphilus]MDV2583480.1 MerR family transcriptional regulator [Alkalibacillus haloalkaliphilus]